MTERSLFWDGNAVLGDDGPYTELHLHNQFFRSILNGTGDRGVLYNWLDALLVSGVSAPVTVAAGGAIAYGFAYENDVAATVSVSTPSAGLSRYDRIVIRATWANYTVRIARVTGVAAVAPAIPALTQTVNVIWEIPLAILLVDDAGTITITDARDYCSFATDWPAGAVTTAKYAVGAVTPAEVPDRTRNDLKDAGSIKPDSANPCGWTVGASYDYWEFADAVTEEGWIYFMGPTGMASGQVDIYVHSVPNVNGAGGGAENCQWDFDTYSGPPGATLPTTNGTVNVDQQARVNTTEYRDQLIAAFAITEGDILMIKLGRDGAADSYNSAMRLLGIEMAWTADA